MGKYGTKRGGASGARRRLTARMRATDMRSDVVRCKCGKLLRIDGVIRAAFKINAAGEFSCVNCGISSMSA